MNYFKDISNYNDLFNSLVCMIKWTKEHKKNCKKFNIIYESKLAYAKELSTIRFQLPRQSGHTTFLKKLIGSYGANGIKGGLLKNPAVIFPTQNNAEIAGFLTKWNWVGTPKTLDKFRGKTFNSIICDCSSLYSSSDFENIYKIFKHYCDEEFIFLFLG